jgi:ABC-type multidrug transport system ATPase subunit
MKVREIISFYLDLKNIKGSTEEVCERFGLTKFLDTYCVNLSGGNKRKLSFAIALMCNPKLLLLDEPSTGVDPESRRIMWKNIMNLNKNGNQFNMILTTHSMEEAEVLCDTVSWLKSGNFLSIGNPEKLKIALSAGYKLNMKFVQLSQQIPNEATYEKALNDASKTIKDFNVLVNNIKMIENIKPYIIEFVKVINLIKGNCLEIALIRINNDFSFEVNLKIIKEKQSALFTQILDMKNTNNLLSEISISMESLENILTKL